MLTDLKTHLEPLSIGKLEENKQKQQQQPTQKKTTEQNFKYLTH